MSHSSALVRASSSGMAALAAPCGKQRLCARSRPSQARWVVQAAAAPLEQLERVQIMGSEPLGSSTTGQRHGGLAVAAPAQPSTSGRVVLEDKSQLKSTWEHRAWVCGTTLLLGATAAQGVSHVTDAGAAGEAVVAALLAYWLADFGTGIYHWIVDNYGDGTTPVLGSQIVAFQGHHMRPWTITEREFCNNVHLVFKPAMPISAVLLASAAAGAPVWWDVWASGMTLMACMSQQFHAWSHMKKSELHPAVVALQDAGVLISRKAHGAHHKAPFEGNYCIVSGWWNPILDANGSDDSFFRRLERLVHATTGLEPRCWTEPAYEWMEMERSE